MRRGTAGKSKKKECQKLTEVQKENSDARCLSSKGGREIMHHHRRETHSRGANHENDNMKWIVHARGITEDAKVCHHTGYLGRE